MDRDDPDDWFDEPAAADSWSARVDRIVRERAPSEDWLREPMHVDPRDQRMHVDPRMLLVAALGVCFLVGILAAAGAFSGGSHVQTLQTIASPRVSTTTPTAPAPRPTVLVPTTPMKPGDTGPSVAKLQRALTLAGYSPGKADGRYGSATVQAIKGFQAAHGLTADGIAGTKTLTALESTVQGG